MKGDFHKYYLVNSPFYCPLHNISNYIKNIYQEIPAHVGKHEKQKTTKVKDAIENLFNGKEAKNYSDYWKSLLVLCSFLLEKSPGSYIT